MKISIITCTYNRIEKLKKNIQSVKNQNFKNYEHFILDDGSNDETQNYISKIKDKKIKYIRFKENLGQPTVIYNSDVFNKITGDYITFLDSDDYFFDGAFDVFFEYYSIYGNSVWNYAFDFSDQKNNFHKLNYKEKNPKIVKVNSMIVLKIIIQEIDKKKVIEIF